MTLTISQYQAETDSFGLQWTNLRALGGTTEGTAVLTGAANNLGRVQALADPKVQRALLDAYDDLHDASAAPWSPSAAWFRAALAALDDDAATGGIIAFLAANATATVTQAFADLLADAGGYDPVPALQILDAKQRIAALTLAPPGAGALVADATGLGTAHTLELVTGSLIGATAITGIAVTGAGGTGTTESLANVPAGTARGTVVATTTGTYKTVTALAHAGGTRGDILILRSSVAGSVRTPAL
jgi:hypothetical protein